MDRNSCYLQDLKKIRVLQLILERHRDNVEITVVNPVHHRSETAAFRSNFKYILLRREAEIDQKTTPVEKRIENFYTSVALRHLEKIRKKYQYLRLVRIGFNFHSLDERREITPRLFDPAQKRSYKFQKNLLKERPQSKRAILGIYRESSRKIVRSLRH